MTHVRKLFTIALMALLAFAIVAQVPMALSVAAIPRGPWLDEVLFFEEKDEIKTLKMIEKGEVHLWLWALKTVEGKKYAEASPEIVLIDAHPGCFNLKLNPVDTIPYTGELNIFAIREVREALNWLLDREFIAKEIMGGFAIPHWTVFPPVRPDYTRLYVDMKALEARYAYNYDKAVEVINDALIKAGCRFVAGKWYYGDKPVVVRFVIRIEDVRKPIGEFLSGVFERIGLTVEKDYGPAIKAIPKVYGGDPTKGEWHIYTEGWAYTAIAAYDDDLPHFMYVSPWSGAIFLYYTPPPPFSDLAERLMKAEYKSVEERNAWVLRLTELALRDSTRVWMVWEKAPFARHKDFVNVAYDITGGAYALYTLRSARFKDVIGGTAKVANFVMFVSAWNPVGGFTWLYDALVERAISDPGVWTHPHTGRYIPIRADFSVKTAGPVAKLPVPADAIIFDPAKREWKTVGPGVEATSAVTFKFAYGPWHHGVEMTIADVMAYIAQMYRISYEGDPLYDPAAVPPAVELFVTLTKGIKIVKPDTVTVYIDYWHVDETFIAYAASVFTTTPWEIYALMNAAVEKKELAFSAPLAKKWGVPWLDLSRGPSIPILDKHLKALEAVKYIPPYLVEWVKPADAEVRYAALRGWYEAKKHFLASNGPFYLDKVDPPAKMATIRAFREYVFTADKWDHLVVPKVPDIEVAPIPDVVPGMPVDIDVTATVAGVPYSNVDVTVLVIDPMGRTVVKKVAELIAPGKFRASLTVAETAGLIPGIYTVTVIAVGWEAALARVVTAPVTVMPLVGYFEERFEGLERTVKGIEKHLEKELGVLGETLGKAIGVLGTELRDALIRLGHELGAALKGVEERTTKEIGEVTEEVELTHDAIKALSKSVEALSGTVTIVMALVAVAVVLSLVSIATSILVIRRR